MSREAVRRQFGDDSLKKLADETYEKLEKMSCLRTIYPPLILLYLMLGLAFFICLPMTMLHLSSIEKMGRLMGISEPGFLGMALAGCCFLIAFFIAMLIKRTWLNPRSNHIKSWLVAAREEPLKRHVLEAIAREDTTILGSYARAILSEK